MTKMSQVLTMVVASFFLRTGACIAADTDTIDTVSDDGSTIVMQSGQTYESDDPVKSSSWQSGDDVVITNGDKIINKNQGGETVDGTEE